VGAALFTLCVFANGLFGSLTGILAQARRTAAYSQRQPIAQATVVTHHVGKNKLG
jgi:hypothetical protein